MSKYSLTQLRGILEEAVSESDPKPYKMAKWAYQACMDTEELEVSFFPKHLYPFFQRLGVAPLKLELEKLGGWPLIQGDKWKESDFNW